MPTSNAPTPLSDVAAQHKFWAGTAHWDPVPPDTRPGFSIYHFPMEKLKALEQRRQVARERREKQEHDLYTQEEKRRAERKGGGAKVKGKW